MAATAHTIDVEQPFHPYQALEQLQRASETLCAQLAARGDIELSQLAACHRQLVARLCEHFLALEDLAVLRLSEVERYAVHRLRARPGHPAASMVFPLE